MSTHYLPLLLLVIGTFAGCGPGTPATDNATAAPVGPVFRISTARPVSEQSPQVNWCIAEFGESIVVGADRINTNRRLFFLPAGVTWLAAGRDNARANLFLRPLENGDVQVFTGANFPYCLSRPEYVRPVANDPARLRYYNEANIDFTLDLQTEQGQPKIALEFQPGTFYAIEAVRCLSCE